MLPVISSDKAVIAAFPRISHLAAPHLMLEVDLIDDIGAIDALCLHSSICDIEGRSQPTAGYPSSPIVEDTVIRALK